MTTPSTFKLGYPPQKYSTVTYAGTYTTDPTSSDVLSPNVGGTWPIGSLRVNKATGGAWILTDVSGSTATWNAITDAASGNVDGPASSTDNALARFDGTTGKLIQNSVGLLSDAGLLTGVRPILPAGTTTAGTAPIKFTSGVNLTVAESGAMEYNGTLLTYTDSVPTRNILAVGPGASTSNGLVSWSSTTGYKLLSNTPTISAGVITFPSGGGNVLTAGAGAAERKGTFVFDGSGTHTKILTTAAVTGCVISYTTVTLGTVTTPQAILTTIDTGVGFTPVSAANNDSSSVNWAIVA